MTQGLHHLAMRAMGALIAALGLGTALADELERVPRVPSLQKYQLECAACHLAYPPGLLPATSWRNILSSLPRHYGADASLDAAAVKELSAWLAANAGTARRAVGAPPQDRITLAAWFTREHDEVAAASWKLPAVKSAANCSACHARAEQGDFNEHDVRIPR
jgi:Dihaem cytochrome c